MAGDGGEVFAAICVLSFAQLTQIFFMKIKHQNPKKVKPIIGLTSFDKRCFSNFEVLTNHRFYHLIHLFHGNNRMGFEIYIWRILLHHFIDFHLRTFDNAIS